MLYSSYFFIVMLSCLHITHRLSLYHSYRSSLKIHCLSEQTVLIFFYFSVYYAVFIKISQKMGPVSSTVMGLHTISIICQGTKCFGYSDCSIGWVDIGTVTKVQLMFVVSFSKVRKMANNIVLTRSSALATEVQYIREIPLIVCKF
jgi:hypothetical protein